MAILWLCKFLKQLLKLYEIYLSHEFCEAFFVVSNCQPKQLLCHLNLPTKCCSEIVLHRNL